MADRFGQIEPKVLLAVDGYRFGAKQIRRDDEVAQITGQLPTLQAVIRVPYLTDDVIRQSLSNPMLLDDLAVDFPDLQIVMAHPSFPWQDEALAVATRKANVWIDLSGWSPKYFPPQLVKYANTLIQDKVLFGSDYPLIPPEKWLADFDALEIKPHVRQKIVKDNVVRLLKLA